MWLSRIAFAAIYLVVVQALLAGLTTGVSAARLELDASDFVICGFNGAQDISRGAGRQHDGAHPPNCCVPGCGMFVPSIAPPPAILSMAVGPTPGRLVAISFADVGVDRYRERRPGNPRAPPRPT